MGLRIAFVIPPLVDLNSPYAAAPRLTGWLRKLGHPAPELATFEEAKQFLDAKWNKPEVAA